MNKQENQLNILEKIYGENNIVGIIVVAFVVFFGKMIMPNQIAKIEAYLIPVFVLIICIEILFIRRKLTRELEEIKRNTATNFKLKSFKKGEGFDNWLENELRVADSLKVAHLSSYDSSSADEKEGGKRKGRRYNKLITDFVKSGKTFHRVFCDTDNVEVFDWIIGDLKKFQDQKYFISFLDKVTVRDVKNISFMIIDNKYVCLGGGYKTRFNRPTIAIENEELVSFYSDYFNHLIAESKSVNLGRKVNIELLENRKIEIEKKAVANKG